MSEGLKAPLDNKAIFYPAHYIAGRSIEPIRVIEEFGLCHHLGCVVKYISRAGRKTSALNDLRKSAWYLDRELQNLRRDLAMCAVPLNQPPDVEIDDVIEDWKLSAHLGTALSYILSLRLDRAGSLKFRENYLLHAMGNLQAAISDIEEGDRP